MVDQSQLAISQLLVRKHPATRATPDPVPNVVLVLACVHHVGLAYISSALRTCTQRMFARYISAIFSLQKQATVILQMFGVVFIFGIFGGQWFY